MPPVPEKPGASAIKPGMSEAEIRAAGLSIDVPFESGDTQPERLKYSDLGPDKKWAPPADWPPQTSSGSAAPPAPSPPSPAPPVPPAPPAEATPPPKK